MMSNIVMHKMNNSDNIKETKDGFKIGFKKLHEQLAKTEQGLEAHLTLKRQLNKDSKNSIEKHSNKSLHTSCLAIDVIPNKVQVQLEADVKDFKSRSDQLSKFYDEIDTKAEDEIKQMCCKFYELIIKDSIALKPFQEIKDANKDLNLKTDCYIREQNVLKANNLKKLMERKVYLDDIQQSISITEKIIFSVENCKKKLEVKLKLHKFKTAAEAATEESNESKQLLADISNLKSQLKIQ